MTFRSVLYATDGSAASQPDHEPAFIADLNLDQVVDAITTRRHDYDLKPFFYQPLHSLDDIAYRQEIARDLENEQTLESIKTFAEAMVVMRRYLGLVEKLYYHFHQAGWFLEAVDAYCQAVSTLAQSLAHTDIRARGLLAFRTALASYVAGEKFTHLLADTRACRDDLASVQYCLTVRDNSVRVRKYESEIDYSVEIEETFAKFKQGAVKDYLVKLPAASGMNHVEAAIINMVAKLYPETFARLDTFCAQHRDFLDPVITRFDREIQFFASYLDYIAALKKAGLQFCYPHLSGADKQIESRQGFDLALAAQCIREQQPIVCNDFYLTDPECIFVVSGPNQGGKTTFARAFGQLHYLAALGLPVPGKHARLYLFDNIFTHFEREEEIANLRGKLQDDLIRIHEILSAATPHSIVIMNEIFTSTALEDAIVLSKAVLEQIMRMDMLCVCVTFIDELATLSEKTVSMVGSVAPDNPDVRTYKIERRPANGLSYALSIAEKHRLTYDWLKERMAA